MAEIIYGDPADLVDERDDAIRHLLRARYAASDMFMRLKAVDQAKRDCKLEPAIELDMWRSAAADIERLYRSQLELAKPLIQGAPV